MKLGRQSLRLHRKTPYKQSWEMKKDGDLWEIFANIVEKGELR